jgi:hypothetical membrane protein
MDHVRTRFWQMPERLTPRRARLSIGLAFVILGLAFVALVGVESEGPTRLLPVAVLVLTGLGNLTLALGSLLPEADGGRVLREVARLLSLLLLVTSIAFLAWILYSAIVYGESVSLLIPAAAAALAVYLAGRLRRQSPNGAH